MKNFEIKNESGRSMIEMLGVLAIIGVLSVGGIAGYSKAMTKYRINKTIEQITLIAGNVRAFFAPQGNYDGLSSYSDTGKAIIKKAKLVPDEMWDDTNKQYTNVFGYGIGVGTDGKYIEGDKQAFYISYDIGDNEEVCIELLSQDWTTSNGKAIQLGNNEDDFYFKAPVSIDKAVTYCSSIIDTTSATNKAKGFPYIDIYYDIDMRGPYWKDGAFNGVLPWL